MHKSERIVEAIKPLMRFSNLAEMSDHPHYKALTKVDQTLAREVLEACHLRQYERNEAAKTPV